MIRLHRVIPKIVGVIAIIFQMILLTGCSLDDPRDACCNLSNGMRYVYRPHFIDEFSQHISSMRHLLYDSEGNFIREMEPGSDIQYHTLAIPAGRYMMVNLGNQSDRSELIQSDDGHVSQLTLESTALHDGKWLPSSLSSLRIGSSDSGIALSNTDELFWGVSEFEIDSQGYISDLGFRRRYDDYGWPVTEMNNIHCHLRVKVEWFNMPPGYGDYELELSGVPSRYSLDPTLSADADRYVVPVSNRTSSHRLTIPLLGFELDADFVTLRYTDSDIPTLRIYYKGEQISPDIDLQRAFTAWGWWPSAVHVQEYAISVTLYSNGKADVTPLIEGIVNDWIDGGSFS